MAFVFAVLVLPILSEKTNCGGNGYALTACAYFTTAAEIVGQENHSRFEMGKMTKSEGKALQILAKEAWGVRNGDFLVKTNFPLGTTNNRQVVVLCLREFANIPRPTIWNFFHQNPAHAVGYSDGTTGLVSPTEFQSLDLSGFASAANLATNSEFKIAE
jgi:hypothetical protein